MKKTPAIAFRPVVLGAAVALACLGTARGQTNVALDGTSGTNTISTSYSTTGGLTLSLGFFADYLIVGGGGAGGQGTGGGGGGSSGTGNGGAGGNSAYLCRPEVPKNTNLSVRRRRRMT